jgi:hypothetical protein
LTDVTGDRCREYVKWRTRQKWKSATRSAARPVSTAAARRELEDLRAAINHHRREGLCREFISVVLPTGEPRDLPHALRSRALAVGSVARQAGHGR